MENENHKGRVISAAVMLAILAVVLWIDNTMFTWIAMGAVYFIAFNESLKFYKTDLKAPSLVAMIVLWIGIYISENPLAIGVVVLCALSLYVICASEDYGYRDIFPFIYPTLPFIMLFDLYEYSVFHLIWLLVVVAIADVCAYYGGKKLGKTKLSDKSPGKTVEGVICGVAPSVIVGAFSGIGIFGSFTAALISSVIISCLSVVGDLFESSLKRSAGLKDSGGIIPGHGGVLDRMDGILFGVVGMLAILSLY